MAHFESFFLVSAYGTLSWCCLCCFGSFLARFFVDQITWNRWSALICLIVAENVSVITGCLVSLFQQDEYLQQPAHQWIRTILLTVLFLTGSIGLVLEQTMVVLIERDRLIVVAQHTGSMCYQDTLCEINVMIRQIDLACQVLAPVFVGSLIGWLQQDTKNSDLSQAAFAVGILKLLSMVVELALMSQLYHVVPSLHTRSHSISSDNTLPLADSITLITPQSNVDNMPQSNVDNMPQPSVDNTPQSNVDTVMYKGFRTYWQQPIAAAGVALSLLYLNVLTFGSLMTAYLLSRGMAMKTVGLWRGLSAFSGLCGTFVYQYLRERLSLVKVGFVSILFQSMILSIGILSLFLPRKNRQHGAIFFLIGSVIMSRMGLYSFDISVMQLMQEHIPAPSRGAIGGTQQSLNAAFEILSYVLSLAIDKPSDFPVYATVGFLGTVVATTLFGWRMLLFKPPSMFSLVETTLT